VSYLGGGLDPLGAGVSYLGGGLDPLGAGVSYLGGGQLMCLVSSPPWELGAMIVHNRPWSAVCLRVYINSVRSTACSYTKKPSPVM